MKNSLEFQSFDLDSPSKDTSSLIDLPADKEEEDRPNRTSQSFWTFEFYQQFFDVNTDEVKERIIWSMIPRGRNFLDSYIKPNPDLYGPIWITTTLIFVIAVSGNVANYLHESARNPEAVPVHWRYDFHLISYAASAITSYVCLVPVALWLFIKYNNSNVTLSFLELVCTYGYSLSVYVPASIICTIQVPALQWCVILAAASMSLIVLVSSIAPSVSGAKKLPVIAAIIGLHYLLAIGVLMYMFNVPAYGSSPSHDSPALKNTNKTDPTEPHIILPPLS